MIYKPHRRVLYMDNTFYIASSVLFYSSPLVRGNSHLVPAIHSVCVQDVFGAGLGWGRQNCCNNTCDIVNDIWNKSYMNCGNEMKMKKWSSQWTQFMQLRKEAWKKNSGLQRGLNPRPRHYRCDALPTELDWGWFCLFNWTHARIALKNSGLFIQQK